MDPNVGRIAVELEKLNREIRQINEVLVHQNELTLELLRKMMEKKD